ASIATVRAAAGVAVAQSPQVKKEKVTVPLGSSAALVGLSETVAESCMFVPRATLSPLFTTVWSALWSVVAVVVSALTTENGSQGLGERRVGAGRVDCARQE